MCHDMFVEVRGQLAGIRSFLLPSEFQESNSSVRLGNKRFYLPSHLTSPYVFLNAIRGMNCL